MINFLQETLNMIKECKKNKDDIKFIKFGTCMYQYDEYKDDIKFKLYEDWEKFEFDADFTYDDGYGVNEISTNSVIVFKDGSWLERGEYDGSEWWEYKETPKRKD